MTNIERETALSRDDVNGQMRLALVELVRIEREIEALTPRVRDGMDEDLLRSLRGCRAALLRMAGVRLYAPSRAEDRSV